MFTTLTEPETEATLEQGRLLAFIYQCPFGLAEVDNHGAVRLLNARGIALMIPLVGVDGIENIHSWLRPHAPDLLELIEKSSGFGEICRDRRILIPQTGALLHLSFTVIRLESDSLMIAFDDVTAIVETERRARNAVAAEAVLSSKAEMAASVLHDIGNSITGVGTRAAHLFAEPPWAETENLARMRFLLQSLPPLLEQVMGAAKTAAILGITTELEDSLRRREITLRKHVAALMVSVLHVQETLSIQRQYVRQDRADDRSPTSLRQMVQDAITIHATSIEKRRIELVLHIPLDLPPLVLDGTLMLRVLGNILLNACESIDRNEPLDAAPRLEISICVKDDAWILLQIKDSGPGFTPGSGEAFFEPGVTSKPQGAGLGLASCRSTVSSHGGHIGIESAGIGKGATVTIGLPYQLIEERNA